MAKRSPAQEAREDTPLPSSLDSEKALLGCLMTDNKALDDTLEKLNSGMFYSSKHRAIFEAVTQLHKKDFQLRQSYQRRLDQKRSRRQSHERGSELKLQSYSSVRLAGPSPRYGYGFRLRADRIHSYR